MGMVDVIRNGFPFKCNRLSSLRWTIHIIFSQFIDMQMQAVHIVKSFDGDRAMRTIYDELMK